MRVYQRMSANPVTVTMETSHREAVDLLKKHNIRRLPVVDKQGNVVGIVSESDLLSSSPSSATTLSVHEIVTLLDKLKVGQIMSHPVYAVDEDCTLSSAARFMVESRIGSLCVMRGDELVGIITETDIFKAFVEALGGGKPGFRVDVIAPDSPGVLAELARAVAEVGGNIVSLTTFEHPDTERGQLSLKVQEADIEKLTTKIAEISGTDLLSSSPANKDQLRVL